MKTKKLFFVLLVTYVFSITALYIHANPWTITASVLTTGTLLIYAFIRIMSEINQIRRITKELEDYKKFIHKQVKKET